MKDHDATVSYLEVLNLVFHFPHVSDPSGQYEITISVPEGREVDHLSATNVLKVAQEFVLAINKYEGKEEKPAFVSKFLSEITISCKRQARGNTFILRLIRLEENVIEEGSFIRIWQKWRFVLFFKEEICMEGGLVCRYKHRVR